MENVELLSIFNVRRKPILASNKETIILFRLTAVPLQIADRRPREALERGRADCLEMTVTLFTLIVNFVLNDNTLLSRENYPLLLSKE